MKNENTPESIASGTSPAVVCNAWLASDAFPVMSLDAALQFADEKRTTGGITTTAALETLAKEVRATREALAKVVNELQGLAMAEYGNIGMAADYAPSLPEALSILANK